MTHCVIVKFLNALNPIVMKLIALLLLVVTTYGVSAQCTAPTGLSTTGITATAATAKWSAVDGVITYNVEYRPESYSFWITIADGTTSLQWSLYGMEPGTTYYWRVRANCTSGASNYTETQFTTMASGSGCGAPGGLSTSNIASTTATANWSAVSGAIGYSVEYKPVSSGSWIFATSGTNLTYVNFYSLSAATTYEWRVRANCSLTESSNYSTVQFTTSGSGSTTPPPPPPPAPGCSGPEDVSTNGTISGAATISFNTDIKGTISGRNDIDHYKFVSSGGSVTVSLTTLPANYNLAVLNNSGSQMGVSQNNGTQSESITLNLAAGTYYAKVFPKGNVQSESSCYTLRVQ